MLVYPYNNNTGYKKSISLYYYLNQCNVGPEGEPEGEPEEGAEPEEGELTNCIGDACDNADEEELPECEEGESPEDEVRI